MRLFWTKLKQILLDILFPVACLGCGAPDVWLCPACRRQLKLNSQDVCPVCKHLSVYGKTHAWCQRSFYLDGLIIAAQSSPLIDKLVHSFKYSLIQDLAPILSQLMVEKIIFNDQQNARPNWTRLLFSSSLIVVPVPLHARRLRWRGFNQSYLLARAITDKFNLILRPYLLKRKKYTTPQAQLSRSQRIKNVQGIFRVNKDWQNSLANAKILLVDDVATTVSTLNECARALKQSGALEVWAIVLTRG